MIDTLADASRGSLTLIESRRLRLVSFALMYVAPGVGVGLFLYAMPAYFAQEGLTPPGDPCEGHAEKHDSNICKNIDRHS